MEKQFCPECGAPTSEDKHLKSCPECGCPLPQQEPTDTEVNTDIKVKASEPQKTVSGKNTITADVEEIGYTEAWRKHRKTEYSISRTLFKFSFFFLLAAIGLSIAFIIYIIVRGVQIDNALLFFFEFRTKTLKFTATIATLAVAEMLTEIIGSCYELVKLSAWLRANNIDTTTCEEAIAYPSLSKKKQNESLQIVKIAYCAAHGEKTSRFVTAHIVECIIITVFFLATGFLTAIAINSIIGNSAGIYGIAYPVGFVIGTCISAGMPELLRSAINKHVNAPVRSWAQSLTD